MRRKGLFGTTRREACRLSLETASHDVPGVQANVPLQGFPPILCVASGKGGVGKTSISLCVASEIAETTRVLLIDLDYFNRGATGLLREDTQPFVDGLSLVEVLPLYKPARPRMCRTTPTRRSP